MHAVIRTGGKQYRVAEGDVLRVEKLDAAPGGKIELDEVLLVADGEDIKVGSPLVEGGKVTAEVRAHGRGDKIEVIKFKRRKKYRRKYGHRQDYTELRVTGISAGAKKASKKTGAKAASEKAESGKAEAGGKAAPKKTESRKSTAGKATPKKAAPKKAASKKAAPKKAAAKKPATAKKSTAAKKTAPDKGKKTSSSGKKAPGKTRR